MRSGVFKYENILGVIESQATPPPNSFEDLINYRHDKRVGGLSNRPGFRNYQDVTYQPDAFQFTSFQNCGSTLVIASSTKIEVITPTNLETGSANTSLLDITSANIADNTIGSLSGSTLNLGTPISGSLSSLYQIVYNSIRLTYAVVILQNTQSQVVLNEDPSVLGWQAGDTLKFFKSNLLFTSSGFVRTLIGQPDLPTIDAFNNLLLSGLYENSSGQSLWIGRIGSKNGSSGSPKSFFGVSDATHAGFTFNGVYAAKLVEDFVSGAFISSLHHIQTKLVTSATTTERLDPDSNYSVVGTWLDEASAPTSNIFPHVADGATPNDATYVSINPGGTGTFTLGMSNLTSGLQINPNGFINVTCRLRAGGAGLGFVAVMHLYELVAGSQVQRGVDIPVAVNNTSFSNFTFNVPAAIFTNVNNAYFRIDYASGSANSMVISWIKFDVDLNVQTVGIDNTKQNPDYALNFSLEIDSSNETGLIYSIPYGAPNNTTSYTDSCQASVGFDTTTNYIGAKIFTATAALINRRATALNIYGGVKEAGGWVWKFCRRVDINDSNWKIDSLNGVSGISIEVQIGNEINTGAVYEDRTGRSSSSTIQSKISVLSKPSLRSLAVNNTDKNIIYFSSISQNGAETSVIPSSNFFVVNDTIGDIIWILSIGQKTIIWKNQSVLSVESSTVSSAPKIQVITRSRGLASIQSVASNGTVAFYVTYDGIYLTNGFTDECINRDWINYFQTTYSKSIIESSIGFFDVASNSYYIQFNISAGVYDLWAMNIETGIWRKEEFIYSDLTPRTEKYGAIKFVCKTLDNRILFADDLSRTTSSFMQIYQFPRDDGATNYYTNKIRRNSGTVEIGTRIRFKTNPVDDSDGIRSGVYIDGGYVKSNLKLVSQTTLYDSAEPNANALTTTNLSIYDGSTDKKDIPIIWGRQETSVRVRGSLSRFALQNEMFTRGFFVVKEFGVYFKQLIKSGSVKEVA